MTPVSKKFLYLGFFFSSILTGIFFTLGSFVSKTWTTSDPPPFDIAPDTAVGRAVAWVIVLALTVSLFMFSRAFAIYLLKTDYPRRYGAVFFYEGTLDRRKSFLAGVWLGLLDLVWVLLAFTLLAILHLRIGIESKILSMILEQVLVIWVTAFVSAYSILRTLRKPPAMSRRGRSPTRLASDAEVAGAKTPPTGFTDTPVDTLTTICDTFWNGSLVAGEEEYPTLSGRDYGQYVNAINELGARGPEILDWAIARIRHADFDAREQVAWLLGHLASRNQLGEKRETVIDELAWLATRSVEDDCKEAQANTAAVIALGHIGGRKAINTFRLVLTSPEWDADDLQWDAAQVLGNLVGESFMDCDDPKAAAKDWLQRHPSISVIEGRALTSQHHLERTLDQTEYRVALNQVLEKHSELAGQRLIRLFEHLPPLARALEIGVSPDQDGEGQFSVYAHLVGPDLYVLNKAIRDYATIFAVKHAEDGFTPNVPMLDPSSVEFVVQDVIFECVASWISLIWKNLNVAPTIPVSIVNDDEFSDHKPVILNR